MALGKEATIIMNGLQLTNAQSMTIRVALSNFHEDLVTNGLGTDATGVAICEGYKNAIRDIFVVMLEKS